MIVGISPRVAVAARQYARHERVRQPPASLKLYSLLDRRPGLLGSTSILDEHGQLWAEFEQYAAEETAAANERAALERARRRRGGFG